MDRALYEFVRACKSILVLGRLFVEHPLQVDVARRVDRRYSGNVLPQAVAKEVR
jgi:hypothetical protein